MRCIAIVDFGGQYAHLIARRIRELGVYSIILRPAEFHCRDEYAGVIFSGGPRSVNDGDLLTIDVDIAKLSVPLLGICYGHQLIARLLGGTVERHQFREYGKVNIVHRDDEGILSRTPEMQPVWMSHGDTVTSLPAGCIVTASTTTTPIAAYRHSEREIFGLQFHPEVTHTLHGKAILDAFVERCVQDRDWDIQKVYEGVLAHLTEETRGKKLITLISGGVDSLVALALCVRAAGAENVHAIHVDTGFMRKNESAHVMEYLAGLGFDTTRLISAGDIFFERLEGRAEPEEKRKIIGGLFVEVLQQALSGLPHDGGWMLVQGTIYPDTIESGGTEQASAIKTHHNRVREIEELIRQGRVIEPLKEFYKDEVRLLGELLGLPPELINRKPFPGPGLAIRALCDDLSDTHAGYEDEIEHADEIASRYGFHALILPVKSVGVQGDARTYMHPVLIFPLVERATDWDAVTECASVLVNTLHTANRVVYSPSATMPLLYRGKTFLTRDRITLLQEVDAIAQDLSSHEKDIWQFPVISLPLYDRNGGQTFVLRPVTSLDAMTADVFRMTDGLYTAILEAVVKVPGAGYVFYDVTTKPPSTIEWE